MTDLHHHGSLAIIAVLFLSFTIIPFLTMDNGLTGMSVADIEEKNAGLNNAKNPLAYIMLAIIVGAVIAGAFYEYQTHFNKKPVNDPIKEAMSQEFKVEEKLSTYFEENLAKGYDVQTLSSELIKHGWDSRQVHAIASKYPVVSHAKVQEASVQDYNKVNLESHKYKRKRPKYNYEF